MIYITFSLLALGVVGVGALFICKGLGHPIKNSYVLARTFSAIFGLAIFLLGMCFYLKSWPYATFFSALFWVLGAQISLWSIGVGGELLSNRPHMEGASGFRKDYLVMGQSRFVLSLAFVSFAMFMLVTFLSNAPWLLPSFLQKHLDPTSTGFIQQVSAATRLPERPNWVTETVRSTDRFGKDIVVELGVLWDPYRWIKGSTEQVSVDDDDKVKFSIGEVIKNFQDTEKRPIIVVGIASHENAAENPELEIGRAQARADTLVTLCGEHFINRPHIYSLNLGAFKSDRRYSAFSASERRVILLVIKKGEDSLDLTSGVKNALIKAKTEEGFIFDARDYSLFETTRFKVVPRFNF